MVSNRRVGGWMAAIAVISLVAAGVVYARGAIGAAHLPLGEIEPLAVSPEATRIASLRDAAQDWAEELDRVVAGLEEQAFVERADARQARTLMQRARALSFERDRALSRARAVGRGPFGAGAGGAESDRLAAWLRRSADATPEASQAIVVHLRVVLDAQAGTSASAFAAPAPAMPGLMVRAAFSARR